MCSSMTGDHDLLQLFCLSNFLVCRFIITGYISHKLRDVASHPGKATAQSAGGFVNCIKGAGRSC